MCSTQAIATRPFVAASPDGALAVAWFWIDIHDTSKRGIALHLVSAEGSSTTLNVVEADNIYVSDPVLTSVGQEGFLLLWGQGPWDGSRVVHARRYDGAGDSVDVSALGDGFWNVVDADGMPSGDVAIIGATTGNQSDLAIRMARDGDLEGTISPVCEKFGHASVALWPDGTAVVAWLNNSIGDWHLKAALFDANGYYGGPAIGDPPSLSGSFGSSLSVAASSDDSFAVAWAQGADVALMRGEVYVYARSGDMLANPVVAKPGNSLGSGVGYRMGISATITPGQYFVVWSDYEEWGYDEPFIHGRFVDDEGVLSDTETLNSCDCFGGFWPSLSGTPQGEFLVAYLSPAAPCDSAVFVSRVTGDGVQAHW